MEQIHIDRLNSIVDALIERGYNPYRQLKGYVLEGLDTYITSNSNAREKIKLIDISLIDEYLLNWNEYQDDKWRLEFLKLLK